MSDVVQERLPPGQYWGQKWIIYAAFDIPKINAQDWRLRVNGLVNSPLDFTHEEFLKLPMKKYVKPFFCVTKWSIKSPEWEGVPMKLLAERARVKPEATWAMFHCADGYTAPVPVEDALHDDSIVATKLNGKPLLPSQGFPARPFIPHLYGWKSAKWLTAIEFIPEYSDGYWERYGYHERGDAGDEERFKGDSGKHSMHRSFGTA